MELQNREWGDYFKMDSIKLFVNIYEYLNKL